MRKPVVHPNANNFNPLEKTNDVSRTFAVIRISPVLKGGIDVSLPMQYHKYIKESGIVFFIHAAHIAYLPSVQMLNAG